MSCPPLLSTRTLAFTYPGGRQVLRAASLDLRPGASVGLLGANGAGKSTLLGALTGTLRGTLSGEIRGGKEGPPARGSIGFATQAVGLYPVLTVEENVEHLARFFVAPRARKSAVERALNDFALTPLARTRVHQLSGGQRRLVHLAASFVHAPPIRFLDEPTVALDFEARALVVAQVRKWRSEGVAVLVTAHYPEDIEELSTELVLLRDGVTQQLGEIGAFLANRTQTLLLRDDAPGAAARELELASNRLEHVREKLDALSEDVRLAELRLSGNRLRDILSRDPSLASFTERSES